MPPRIARMMTAERTGLLAVIAIILFIAAISMCDRMPSGSDGNAVLDTVMVSRIDSSLHARPDTASHSPAKAGRKKSSKKKTEPNPRMRLYLDQRVDSGGEDR